MSGKHWTIFIFLKMTRKKEQLDEFYGTIDVYRIQLMISKCYVQGYVWFLFYFVQASVQRESQFDLVVKLSG